MKLGVQAIALSFLVSSCAASEDSSTATPTPVVAKPAPAEQTAPPEAPEAPAPPEASAITPSVASARLAQDCPEPKPASAAAKEMPSAGASAKRSRRSDSGSFRQPCTQSSVQIAFSKTGETGAKVELRAVRLLGAEGQDLGPLSVRMPTRWNQSSYEAWDGMLAPNAEEKASYKLSLPDWTAVEKSLGKSSYGTMYILEVDVDIAGVVSTIRSPQFERARPQNIRT